MKVLILFATIEGQTGKVANFVMQEVRNYDLDAEIIDLSKRSVPVSFDGVDAAVLAAPVHERRHPKPFEVFLAASRNDLARLRTLLLSVSLSAAFPEGHEDAREYVTEMNMRTRFAPDDVAYVAGAVRNRRYDYFAQQIIRHVVLRGKDYNPSDGDHEFTDWNALAATLSKFFATCGPRSEGD